MPGLLSSVPCDVSWLDEHTALASAVRWAPDLSAWCQGLHMAAPTLHPLGLAESPAHQGDGKTFLGSDVSLALGEGQAAWTQGIDAHFPGRESRVLSVTGIWPHPPPDPRPGRRVTHPSHTRGLHWETHGAMLTWEHTHTHRLNHGAARIAQEASG